MTLDSSPKLGSIKSRIAEAKGGRVGLLPTVEDVARVAAVSRQTVSNVLNTPDIVKSETRERVQAAIAQLGYRPNLSARRLRKQASATIGVRLDPLRNGISGAVLDRFVHALTEQADARSMRVLLFTADSPEREIEQIRRLRDGADVDAFVLTGTFFRDPRTEVLIDEGIPFVSFGRPWGIDDMNDPQHLWVDVDGRAGVYDATIALIDAGATRVPWVGWSIASDTGEDRRSGWEQAMRERFGTTREQLDALRIETPDDVGDATEAVAAALTGGLDPDGLVCASDTLALGAMIAAASAGIRDLPVIGFDNTPVAAALGMSSVEQPLDLVAASALELLLGKSGNTIAPRSSMPGASHRLIRPTLVERRASHLPLSGTTKSTTNSTTSGTTEMAADAVGNHRKETR
jgi:DNA-binding LacI/PurR family transcriptional regulator